MKRCVTKQPAPLTPVVKWLLIINVAVWFIFHVIMEGFLRIPFTSIFGLFPGKVLYDFQIWQLFSYMFLHSMQVTHILFNMLMLWFFGAELEQRCGSKFFLIYYFTSGIGAAILYCLGVWGYALAMGSQTGLIVPVIGASGAVFRLLLAQGIIFRERIVYFFLRFPMKTRYFVALMGLVQVASMMTSALAWVARKNNTRLLILRMVSDIVSEAGGEAYDNIDLFHERTKAIMKQLVGQLPEWVQVVKL